MRRFYLCMSMSLTALCHLDAQHLSAKYNDTVDDACNIPQSLLAKVGRDLHRQPRHPLNTIKVLIETALQKHAKLEAESPYKVFAALPPFVSTKDNFDDLLTPADHVSRRPTDTYYANRGTVLRTHTSAHQSQLYRAREVRILAAHTCPNDDVQRSFVVAADVYRRDEIDSSHYPAFHQMEGVRLFDAEKVHAGGLRRDRIGDTGPHEESVFRSCESYSCVRIGKRPFSRHTRCKLRLLWSVTSRTL